MSRKSKPVLPSRIYNEPREVRGVEVPAMPYDDFAREAGNYDALTADWLRSQTAISVALAEEALEGKAELFDHYPAYAVAYLATRSATQNQFFIDELTSNE